MTTEQRAALIIKQVNELAQMPTHEAAAEHKASLHHLIWLSLETQDDNSLDMIEQSLAGGAKQIYMQMLNEVAFETPIKNGQRILYPQLIAIPLVIERDCFGYELPEKLVEHAAVRNAIHNALPDRTARGLSVHQKLYSYGELSQVSLSQLYRMTMATVKSAWSKAEIAPLELQDAPHDNYTIGVSETSGTVIALRFILATTFSYTKSDCYMDEASLKALGQLLGFFLDENPATTTKVTAFCPQRLDKALVAGLPTLYSKVARTLMCMSKPLKVELQMSVSDDDGILKMTGEGDRFTGIPVFFPLGQDDMTGKILSSLHEAATEFSEASFSITYGTSEVSVLH